MAVQVDWNAQLVIGLRKANAKIVSTALEKGADVEKTFFVCKINNFFVFLQI